MSGAKLHRVVGSIQRREGSQLDMCMRRGHRSRGPSAAPARSGSLNKPSADRPADSECRVSFVLASPRKERRTGVARMSGESVIIGDRYR